MKTQLIRELSLVSYAEGLSSAELIWTNVMRNKVIRLLTPSPLELS